MPQWDTAQQQRALGAVAPRAPAPAAGPSRVRKKIPGGAARRAAAGVAPHSLPPRAWSGLCPARAPRAACCSLLLPQGHWAEPPHSPPLTGVNRGPTDRRSQRPNRPAMTDLIQSIKTAGAFALNNANSVQAIFFEDASCVRTDCDAQLIITIPFTTAVRLSAIALRAVPGEEPTLLKVFLDKPELSFDDVQDTRPAFEVKGAGAEVWGGKPAQLPATKFPACNSVTLFFDAEGKDTVALSRVVLFGSTVEHADVSKISAVRGRGVGGEGGARRRPLGSALGARAPTRRSLSRNTARHSNRAEDNSCTPTLPRWGAAAARAAGAASH